MLFLLLHSIGSSQKLASFNISSIGQDGSESDWIDAEDDDDEDDDESNEMDECEDEACCEGDHNHDHEHSHGHQHEHEAMDDEETGDASLDKLKSLIRENGMESLFPPLDGTALYSMMCKINHSCYPNVRVKYVFAREYGLVAELVALREIRPDDELLQSYIDQTMGKDLFLMKQ